MAELQTEDNLQMDSFEIQKNFSYILDNDSRKFAGTGGATP